MKLINSMKTILVILLFVLVRVEGYGQIDFEKKHSDKKLYQKSTEANKAILNGNYGEIHSLLVVKKGKLVYENYYNGWKKDSLHQAQSVTKSIIATVLGAAIQQKIIGGINDRITDYFSSYKSVSEGAQKIKIKDLLTQRHGLKWSERPWNSPDNNWRNLINTSGDWYKAILETPLENNPGSVFNYSNAAPVLISGAIQNASGIPIDVFTKKYLFDELDIKEYRFWQGNGGVSKNGMALVFLKSRDLAKIGQLYLQKGKWDGKQIIPEDFAVKATSSVVKAAESNPMYKQYDYGYFWWVNPVDRKGKEYDVFMARGAGGQHIIVDPKRDIVIIITAWNLTRPNIVQTIFDNHIANTD